MLNNNFKGEMLKDVGKANKSLVLWMQAAHDHGEADQAVRYLMLHYSIFVQLREALLKDGLPPDIAAEATRIAGGPFPFSAVVF